jgi:hypothetical protein
MNQQGRNKREDEALPLPGHAIGTRGGLAADDGTRVVNMRRSSAPTTSRATRFRGLVREATLAASSHNTQPWKFRIGDRSIAIFPDLSRRCPVVDPDDHHLHVSLGCATENLVCGALANGLYAQVECRQDRIDVAFEEALPIRSTLYDALPSRQCSRSLYDGRRLPRGELDLLERAARRPGVHAIFLTSPSQIETVLEYVTRGNAAQIGRAAFVRELGSWIRFNEADAMRTGDGLSSLSTGNPSTPGWLGRLLLPAVLRPKSESDKCARQLRSSAGVVVFLSDGNDPRHWVDVGRSYERFALQATALGIRNAFMNPPVEVEPLRAQFAAWLNAGDRRADLVVRFGRGPEMPRSRRRPLEQVLVSGADPG